MKRAIPRIGMYFHSSANHTQSRGLHVGRRLPDVTWRVRAGVDASHHARGHSSEPSLARASEPSAPVVEMGPPPRDGASSPPRGPFSSNPFRARVRSQSHVRAGTLDQGLWKLPELWTRRTDGATTSSLDAG